MKLLNFFRIIIRKWFDKNPEKATDDINKSDYSRNQEMDQTAPIFLTDPIIITQPKGKPYRFTESYLRFPPSQV